MNWLAAALFVLAMVALVLDWLQTLVIAEPGGWTEGWNVLLRGEPGKARVHLWFGFVFVASLALAWLLWPYPIALGALSAAGGIFEAVCVVHNWRAGIRP